MTQEQSARAARGRVWTKGRLALAAAACALLAAVFTPGCNPTDGSGNVKSPAAPNAPAAAATPAAPTRPARTNRASDAPPTPDPNPAALPDTVNAASLTDTAGKSFKLSDYAGKVVVLNLWATWCGPCRREIPEFVEMREEFAGKDVEILGVTMEDERNTAEDVAEFVKEFGINYRIAWVDLDFYKTMLAPGYQIPQTYVLDKEGRVIYKFVGYNARVGDEVRAVVTQAL